ncbi:ApbE family lipoprotein (plasmid) [Gemmatirosa kalamazoonensis]|uniref:FAD:protein FMN transferase n=1 Tax=Gemmatirosa kalamazoonensis TaxID=861299 RepID=W0RSQ2_9BACT|nr:FAD:protein FMN transferase [Gemmatirosa kalamazoonensis]AHG92613.1 ApbE family lipoprotein [Gemmatirosa kalamazoonensis]
MTSTEIGRREFMGLAVGAFVVAAVPLARRRPAGVVRRSVPVMGTIAQFAVVDRDPLHAHAAIDAAVAELRWVERTMTRFTDTSDVGRANRLAMRDAVAVTPETAYVAAEGLRWADALDGRYDPAVGAVCVLWDVKHRHEPPPDDRVAELAGRRFHRAVELGTRGGGHVLRYHDDGARLDLGSVAKGYGVDRAVAALRRHGVAKAVVVAGGDLYALGTAPDDAPWTIGIQSPTDERALAGTLRLADRAVATSGTYRQFFRYRGRRYHHIMDPATARPRATAMQSLSIVADSVMRADAATTALFGMSEPEIVRELARNLPGAQLARII